MELDNFFINVLNEYFRLDIKDEIKKELTDEVFIDSARYLGLEIDVDQLKLLRNAVDKISTCVESAIKEISESMANESLYFPVEKDYVSPHEFLTSANFRG